MEAESQARNKASAPEAKRGGLFLFAASGIGIYVLLKTLDPSIAFPLRQISSWLATHFLNALSVQCTLSGTVITTGVFVFDVNPDCSGSTSLRIMLTLGALWFGMYPNLTLVRRLICLALAAPIAVLFNAVRVTALVAMGHARGETVEGFPHELIGIASFGLAMGTVYLMTLLMAREPEIQKRSGPGAHLAFLSLALVVCYGPVLWGVWASARDTLSAVGHTSFVLVALGMIGFTIRMVPPGERARPWIPVGIFAGSIVLLGVGTMIDVITLSSLSLVGVLFALLLYLRGWPYTLRVLPLLGVFFLGLPGLHFFSTTALLRKVIPSADDRVTMLLQIVVAGALLALCYFLFLGRPVAPRSSDSRAPFPLPLRLVALPMKIFVFAAFLGVLFQTYFNSQAAAFDRVSQLEVPGVLGDWVGQALEPSDLEKEVLGGSRILSRRYAKEGEEVIHLLANSTAADRTRAHRPERCMQARGWEVQEEEVTRYPGPLGEMPMTKMLLERQGEQLEMRYWLEDPEGKAYGSLSSLRGVDVVRRLTGRRTDWHVYRVFGSPGSSSIDDFLNELQRHR